MPNSLPIPPELQHLIEKRSGKDRRKSRSAPERQSEGQPSAGAAADRSPNEAAAQEPPAIKERRSGRDRRRSGVRGSGADSPGAAGGQ